LCDILSEQQIEQLAIETGFVKRRSKMGAVDFLRMLFLDHLQYKLPSLEQHSLSLEEDSGKSYSKEAINKRFNEYSLKFVQKLLEVFLNKQLHSIALQSELPIHFNSVRILDSTEFKLPDSLAAAFPGYSASNVLACTAIQMEYDVISKKIHCLYIGNARQSDKTFADLRINDIASGDLIVRDLGYHSVDGHQRIEQQKAFYVSRLAYKIGIYERKGNDYKKISWKTLLSRVKKRAGGCYDQWVYIGKEQKHPVRLMAWALPPQEQQKRLKKKHNKKGKLRQRIKYGANSMFLLPTYQLIFWVPTKFTNCIKSAGR
jgi:Transposase DDE domain